MKDFSRSFCFLHISRQNCWYSLSASLLKYASLSCSQMRKYSSAIIFLISMIKFCSRSRMPRAESREIPTIFDTSVAGRLSAKKKIAVALLCRGMREPVNSRSRMDLEATSSSSIPDCGDSVAAYMKRPRDRANRLVPHESVYNFLSNAKQAAGGVMSLSLLQSLSV